MIALMQFVNFGDPQQNVKDFEIHAKMKLLRNNVLKLRTAYGVNQKDDLALLLDKFATVSFIMDHLV